MKIDSERGAKLLLVPTFALLVFVTSRESLNFGPLEYLIFVFAVARMGRMIAFDKVFEPFRALLFAGTYKHPHAGEYTDARKDVDGWRRAVGDLVTCPICASMWATLAATIGLIIAPAFAWRMITIFALVSGGEVVISLIEYLCWNADESRRNTGAPYAASEKDGTK